MLRKILIDAFRTREREDVVAWCEKHVRDIPYSNYRGNFIAARSPMLADVMRAIASQENRKIIISACVQSGKTLAPELCLCYFIANDPGAVLWLVEKDEASKDQSEARLQPLFGECEPVKRLFPQNPDKKRVRSIIFQNGTPLWFAGARNKNNLQRRTIRYVFGDECWLWPKGHMAEAEARTTAFGVRGKCVFMSQGSFTGDDFDRAFRASDAREWCFKCPHCGKVQPFRWSQIEWQKKDTDGNELPLREKLASVRLHCCACNAAFVAAQRRELNASARFVATNPDCVPGNVGFHWNALATMDWSALVAEYLEAKRRSRRGSQDSLREFYQKRLAEAWGIETADDETEIIQSAFGNDADAYRFGDEWNEESVFDAASKTWITRSEHPAPESAMPLRFMSVDVQEAHFYYVVRAWNLSGSSRLVARGMTMDADELERVRERFRVAPKLFFIDAHYKTQIIKTLCIRNGYTALMGDRRDAFPHTANGKTVFRPYSKKILFAGNTAPGKTGNLYLFSNRAVKDTLAEIRAGKTEMRWEIPRDIDPVYLKQINVEYFDAEKQAWICPDGKDNHFFDCETMQIAAALMSKIIGKES